MDKRDPGGRWLPGVRPAGAGRPPGAITKRNRQLQETLERNNFDVGETWLEMIGEARKFLEHGRREEKLAAIKLIVDVTNQIADRMYPRLKAIEHQQSNPYEGMEPQQKIEMMKAAAQALEEQLVRDRSPLIGDSSEDSK